jgi:hypothetical protein
MMAFSTDMFLRLVPFLAAVYLVLYLARRRARLIDRRDKN